METKTNAGPYGDTRRRQATSNACEFKETGVPVPGGRDFKNQKCYLYKKNTAKSWLVKLCRLTNCSLHGIEWYISLAPRPPLLSTGGCFLDDSKEIKVTPFGQRHLMIKNCPWNFTTFLSNFTGSQVPSSASSPCLCHGCF